MKKLTIVLLLTLNWIALSAQSDSLYTIHKSKLYKLLDVYFYKYPSCDSLVIKYQQALLQADSTINSGNKVILLRTKQRDLKALEVITWQNRFNDANTYHKQELKAQRKKTAKITLIAVIEAVVIVLLIL